MNTINKYRKLLNEAFRKIYLFGSYYTDARFNDCDLSSNLNFSNEYTTDTNNGRFSIKLNTFIENFKMFCNITVSLLVDDIPIKEFDFTIDEDGYHRLNEFIEYDLFLDGYSININITNRFSKIENRNPNNNLTIKHIPKVIGVVNGTKYNRSTVNITAGNINSENYIDVITSDSTVIKVISDYLTAMYRVNQCFDGFKKSDICIISPYMPSTELVSVIDVIRNGDSIPLTDRKRYYDKDIVNIELYSTYIRVTVKLDEMEVSLFLSNDINCLNEDLDLIDTLGYAELGTNWEECQCFSADIHRKISPIKKHRPIIKVDKTIVKAIKTAILVLEEKIEKCNSAIQYHNDIEEYKRKGLFDFGLTDLNTKLSRDLFKGALDD